MDVRVDNFLDFCKIFYPSRYRLEMKKPGFDFSLLEAEIRENGGIDVNNIFFNGFCVEETDKLDFDNFDIEKQLAKLDNDLDKAKYLINCFDFIFRMPLLPFLPEKDLSVEPYYTTKEIVTSLLENKMFGINLFEKFYFIYDLITRNENFSSAFYGYNTSIGLSYIYEYFSSYIKAYESYKENKSNLNDSIINNYFSNFLKDIWFNHLTNENFTYRIIKLDNNKEPNYCSSFYREQKNHDNLNFKEKELFENEFELFKKNKLFLNQDLFVENTNSFIVGDINQEYLFKLTFKYSDNLKSSVVLNIDISDRTFTNVYIPLPPTENIKTKLELKNYRKKVLKNNNGFDGPFKRNIIGVNKNGGTSNQDGDIIPLSYYIFNDFVTGEIIPKKPEEGNSNVDFTVVFISKNIYGLIEKKDLINTDTSLFTERFINKAKRYLMRNRNDKLFESVPNEMIERVIEQDIA